MALHIDLKDRNPSSNALDFPVQVREKLLPESIGHSLTIDEITAGCGASGELAPATAGSVVLNLFTAQLPHQTISLSLEPDVARQLATMLLEQSDVAEQAATPLGKDLRKIAEQYRASGAKQFTHEEILAELAERRG